MSSTTRIDNLAKRSHMPFEPEVLPSVFASSGKTCLAKLILELEKPTEGTIAILDSRKVQIQETKEHLNLLNHQNALDAVD